MSVTRAGGRKRTWRWLAIVSAVSTFAICATPSAAQTPTLDDLNVVWDSPSTDSWGSMPIGNGDIGLNVWVGEDGDLLFYVSKTDSWSENARILKLGRIRVSFTPNPFAPGNSFSQELVLRDGVIEIAAGEGDSAVDLRVWVDANHPVIRVQGESAQAIDVAAELEVWRTERRLLKGTDDWLEMRSAFGLQDREDGNSQSPNPDYHVFVEPDVIVPNLTDQILWYHRNERSAFNVTLEVQAQGDLIGRVRDPLLHRTFGGLMEGEGFVSASPTRLTSEEAMRSIDLSIFPHTAQTESIDQWRRQLEGNVARIKAIAGDDRRAAHAAWWRSFWDRHWIYVMSEQEANMALGVSRGYALQRFMAAGSGRGELPIKFNGSIFTVDLAHPLKRFPAGFDADFRDWGGAYWFQNTRLPYFPMLISGDFEFMRPLFRMYLNGLEIARYRTRKYYGHEGAYFPEHMYFWGSWTNAVYGWNRENREDGYSINDFIRYHWEGPIELIGIMLDYFAMTQDRDFVANELLPFAHEILTFYDQHYERDENGKISIFPAQSLEAYRGADVRNPQPEVAGLTFVLGKLLALPEDITSPEQRSFWLRIQGELPPIPIREVPIGFDSSGQLVTLPILGPHELPKGSSGGLEHPQLYAVFPFRLYGVGKPDLQPALEAYERRREGRGGWHQDPIFAAMLGVTEDAKRDVTDYFNVKDLITGTSNTAFRFPAMWGPNYDWVPDQDHGGVAMTALQRMLVHYEDRRIILFPAWPQEWDVSFKVHLPYRTIVEGEFRAGEVRRLRVDPPERAGDIEFANFGAPTAVSAVEERALPGHFELAQNYPNPFNRETIIRFSLPRPGRAELSIYNLSGQRLAVMAKDHLDAGIHEVRWDGLNDSGERVGSGVYLYRLVVGESAKSRKLVLLK